MGGPKAPALLALAAAVLGLVALPPAAAEGGPDLVVDVVVVSPGEMWEGDRAVLSGRIKNVGNSDAGIFSVQAFVDDELVGEGPVRMPIDAQAITVDFEWDATPGSHSARIVADSGDEVAESDEENNAYKAAFTVFAATLGNVGLRLDGFDLVPAEPDARDDPYFSIGVRNGGSEASTAFVARIQVDGELFDEVDIGPLAPGAGTRVSSRLMLNPVPGPHEAAVRIDPYGSRASNEKVASFPFEVRGTGASTADPGPTSPAVSSPAPVPVVPTPTTYADGADTVLATDVAVERDGDQTVITWTSGLAGRAGFQVWRSNSPYVLLAVVNGTTYTDSSPGAKDDSRYLVTAFTGLTPAQGYFVPPAAPDTSVYPGVAAPGFPVWPVALGSALLLGAVAGAGVYAVRRGRRRAQGGSASVPGEAAPSIAGKDVLAVQDIRVVRGTKVLVDGISLRVGSGKTTLLFGPSGSGKSLLLKSIVGLVEHSGHAYDLTRGAGVPLGKEAFGYVPQEIQLYPTLSAMENVLYFAGQFGIPRREAKERASGLLGDLGLAEHADQELQKLSGGQQRRVSVAAALIHQPRILVMDEPSSGLDFSARRTLWELLRRLAETRSIAVLASTHFIDEAEYASEVGIVYKGRLVAHGTTESLIRTLPGQGRCVEVTFDTLGAADAERLRGFLPQLKKMDLATTASYRLYSARYYAKAPATTMARLPGLLRAAGLSARSSSLEDIGLDDVFTFLTGDSLPGDPA